MGIGIRGLHPIVVSINRLIVSSGSGIICTVWGNSWMVYACRRAEVSNRPGNGFRRIGAGAMAFNAECAGEGSSRKGAEDVREIKMSKPRQEAVGVCEVDVSDPMNISC